MSGATALPLPLGTPEDLTAVSNILVRAADRVGQTLIAQHGGGSTVIASSWQGDAAESRTMEANRLRLRLTGATDKLPTIGTALTTYGTTLETTIENVETWQTQWDEAEETYQTNMRHLRNEPDEEGFDKQAVADGWADERDQEHGRLIRLYTDAMDDLTTAGTSAASTIRGACNLVVPEGNAGDRLEVGAYLLRDLPLSGGEAMSELAAELAPELAEELREAASSNDPDALAAIMEEYGEYADDPYFAQALMAELEAEGLQSVFNDLAIANVRYGVQDEELLGKQQEVMTMLGTLYATASGPADGDVDPHGYNRAGIEQWREEVWFPALTESGRTSYELGDEGFAGGYYDGYWMQGQLLSAGTDAGVTPGADYMRHVGQDLVAWDQARGAWDGGRDWDFAAPSGMNRPDLLGMADDAPRAVSADDPVHALLAAAAEDEASTHALLLAEVPGENGEQTVVDYLVRERGGTIAYGQPFMDNGQLLAETVAEHGTDRGDEGSTALAGHYLNAYVDTIGGGTYANGEELSDYAFDAGRTATADVIATHVEDFMRTTSMADPTALTYSNVPGEDSFVVHFDEDTRNNFARMFGYLALDRPEDLAYADASGVQGDPDNPPALQRIINAAMAHTSTALHEGLASHDGNWDSYPPDPAVTAVHEGAGFLTYVGESAGLGLTENAEAEQAYNEYIKTMVSSGAGLVPLGDLIPGGSIIDSTAGLAYSAGTDAILDRMIDTDQVNRADVAGSSLNVHIRSLLDQQIMNAVAESNSWPDGQDPVTWAADPGRTMTEDNTFIRDGKLMPLDEIFASDERSANFLVHYLGDEYTGGQPALQPLLDQIEGAIASGGVADDHWNLR